MKIGSLFSGAGGLDMAVEQVFGAETVWQCEYDPAASKVLATRWPDVPNLHDVTEINWSNWKILLEVDILCGGFPCQDVSAAGRRAGIREGSRSGLWSYFADAIDALRPRVVVIENVRGLLSAGAHRAMESADAAVGDESDGLVLLRAAGAVLGDLADLGYDAQWATVAASDVGSCHERKRVFIVAYPANTQPGYEPQSSDARPFELGTDTGTSIVDRPRRIAARNRQLGWSTAELATVDHLLPTICAADANDGGGNPDLNKQDTLPAALKLLPTPEAKNAHASQDFARENRPGSGGDDLVTAIVKGYESQWGKYAPAIGRWEHLTRPAPYPTEPNTKGNPRLAPAFAEWMMGWPAGWVTDIEISRNDQLRIIGNGVVPQQAIAALRWLLAVAEIAA